MADLEELARAGVAVESGLLASRRRRAQSRLPATHVERPPLGDAQGRCESRWAHCARRRRQPLDHGRGRARRRAAAARARVGCGHRNRHGARRRSRAHRARSGTRAARAPAAARRARFAAAYPGYRAGARRVRTCDRLYDAGGARRQRVRGAQYPHRDTARARRPHRPRSAARSAGRSRVQRDTRRGGTGARGSISRSSAWSTSSCSTSRPACSAMQLDRCSVSRRSSA